MTVKCVDCKRFDLRAVENMGKHGMGYCPVRSMNKGHTFYAVSPRACESFEAAPSGTAEGRLAWLRKKGAV